MAPVRTMRNILMELRKVCQHPYLSAPELENEDVPDDEQHKQLVSASGKLSFLRLLLPKLQERGHRVLLFSQFKIALNRIEDFLYGEGYKFLRLDGDVQQAERQKAMDAFNAPGSDYFIFLLTTRAGGVGINLATADTVILHDPDFNPHMDLQAIARSHRYGQKKRVLVFKLMTKDSVEEKIIQKGKRKMVLDHLVVQQLGKENEEGEIDNILLHGAASLYASDQNGVSASDIRYTADDVEDLINKVEKDAETEAAAMEEREKMQANGGDDTTKPKETMSFGFAKVWESDQKRLQDAEPDADEDRPEELVNAWQLVMENAVKERARRLAEETEAARIRRVRKAATVQYRVDPGAISDDTTPAKKKKAGRVPKQKKREKNGARLSDADDADFAVDPNEPESEDESIASFSGDVADLLNEDGKVASNANSGPPGETSVDPARAVEAAIAGAAAAAAVAAATAGSSTAPPPGNLGSKRNQTHEERVARKAAKSLLSPEERKQRKEQKKLAKLANALTTNVSSRASPSAANTEQAILAAAVTPDRQVSADAALLLPGQTVLAWMFSIFRDRGKALHQNEWGLLALPEVKAYIRQQLYDKLAKFADELLRDEGAPPYFTLPAQNASVSRLIDLGGPGMPEGDFLPQRPGDVPRISEVALDETYNRHLPTPYTSPKGKPRSIAAPAAPQPFNSLQEVPAAAQQSSSTPLRIAEFVDVPMSGSNSAGQNGFEPDTTHSSGPAKTCATCGQEEHEGSDCNDIASVADLISFRDIILDSQESPEDKASGIEEIRKLLHIHYQAGRLDPASWDLYNRDPMVAIRYRDRRLGSKDAAIIIDDDEDDMPQPPQKKARIDLSSSAPQISGSQSSQVNASQMDQVIGNGSRSAEVGGVAQGASPRVRKARARHFKGCLICGREPDHPARLCPVMRSGSQAIQEAMRKFERTDPMWPVMEQLLRESLDSERKLSASTQASSHLLAPPSRPVGTPEVLCPFCGERCGRTIRQCAEAHGGRKQLKDAIRRLEAQRVPGTNPRLDSTVDALFKAYQEWPKPAKAT